ncbi:hypothetical protein HanIR_Chr14g0722791 [Helianthus annuus]|nr:hypothetical protein HanIR_Chr14g0722791 [Helianthus annuus]
MILQTTVTLHGYHLVVEAFHRTIGSVTLVLRSRPTLRLRFLIV